jgi:UDP-N-acetylglucosamine diphosphorylase/glucosamine-1-phosphate N-acetyltransferase
VKVCPLAFFGVFLSTDFQIAGYGAVRRNLLFENQTLEAAAHRPFPTFGAKPPEENEATCRCDDRQKGFMHQGIGAIILAAGLGKRMKSPKAKVLHEILGRPMVSYVVETARKIAGAAVVVVVGNQAEEVRRAVASSGEVIFAYQDRQLGTGHAVMCALPQLPADCTDVMVLCGDVPLVTEATLSAMITDHLKTGREATLLAVDLENPHGYGRILLDAANQICDIVEEADATDGQRAVKTINSGIYCINRQFLEEALPRLTPNNAQGEFYLTDIIRVGYELGRHIGLAHSGDPQEILGINTPDDLLRVEEIMAGRRDNIS